jgi:hypothetical protein
MLVPFVARRMSKRYSILRHVFSSMWGSQKRLQRWFVHEVKPYDQLLNGIPGPLYSRKRKYPMGLYLGSEGSIPPNTSILKILFTGSLTVRPHWGRPPSWSKSFVENGPSVGLQVTNNIEKNCIVHGFLLNERRWVQSSHDEEGRTIHSTWSYPVRIPMRRVGTKYHILHIIITWNSANSKNVTTSWD